MSTRSVIARPVEGPSFAWEGRYHHSDGYPSGVGKTLWELLHGRFAGEESALLKVLLDDHPAGWSNIIDADWSQEPGFLNHRSPAEGQTWAEFSRTCRPQCYCHGARDEEGQDFITSEGDDWGTEWCYVINLFDRTLTVRENVDYETGGKERWRLKAVVPLDGPEPDWSTFE